MNDATRAYLAQNREQAASSSCPMAGTGSVHLRQARQGLSRDGQHRCKQVPGRVRRRRLLDDSLRHG